MCLRGLDCDSDHAIVLDDGHARGGHCQNVGLCHVVVCRTLGLMLCLGFCMRAASVCRKTKQNDVQTRWGKKWKRKTYARRVPKGTHDETLWVLGGYMYIHAQGCMGSKQGPKRPACCGGCLGVYDERIGGILAEHEAREDGGTKYISGALRIRSRPAKQSEGLKKEPNRAKIKIKVKEKRQQNG